MNQTENKTAEYKILVVDDEPQVAASLEEAIEDAGFAAIYATSAADAIASIAQHSNSIAAIISDLRMPNVDGLELRTKLLEKYREIPFIVHSGFVTRELALRGVELKIAAFIEKPAKDADIVSILQRETVQRVSQLKERQAIEQTFFSEAHSIIEELEPLILSLEENPHDPDTINAIFRLVHTLKGSSGILDTDIFYKFVHRFEDMLTKFKSRELAISSAAISAMLRGYDIVKMMIASLEARDGTVFDLQALIDQIKIDGRNRSDAEQQTKKQEPALKSTANKSEAKSDTIKVTTKTLDEFMEQSGEITVIRNMVNKLVRAIEKNQPGNKDINLLAELLDEMHKINGSLQGRIVDLRKVSVAASMRPLKRTIRDLSSSLGKDLELITSGEELRIDTAISQVLADSLIHLVRNSADHGIETREQRAATSKDRTGRIKVSCREEHEEVIVTIADDGRGIDTERVKKKLIENGMMTAEDINLLSKPQLLAKIFEPGFSTAASVSEVSGRGVGMDMVKSSVDRVGGRIEIATEIGSGTTFTLHLPVPKSVLIISSLLVTAAQQVFAIPQDSVVRLLQLSPTQAQIQIAELQGGMVLRTSEQLIPLISLQTVLKLETSKTSNKASHEDLNILIVKGDSATFGIIVDEILDGEEVVVKPIGKHLESLQCFSGATFLGDGHVGLILDINGIEKFAQIGGVEETSDTNSAAALSGKPQRDYILFRLHRVGCYGVPLQQIYRLEEIAIANMRYSGDQRVAIYRNTILPIYDLDSLLGFLSPNFDGLDTVPVLVFEHNKRLFGLVVKTILDIVSGESEPDPSIRDRVGIDGNMFVGDETICVVNFRDLLAHRGHITLEEPVISATNENVIPLKSPQIVTDAAPADSPTDSPREGTEQTEEDQAAGWGLFA